MHTRSLLPLLCVLQAAAVLGSAAFAAETPPNVILVMTDDQGWGEVGFHGNKVLKTPNLDRFAAEGIELTNFYVSPMCTPTRSSLMTGRYHFRTGAHDTYIGRSNMNPQETTIAEVFASAGYRTGIFGKWHLGENYPMRAADQGFQKVVVHGGGGIGQFADFPGNTYWDPVLLYNDKFKKAKGYCTDIFIDESISFMQNNRDQPFFCYLPLNVPHSPFDVDDKFREPYDKQNLADPDGRKWVAPIYGMISQFDGAFQRLLNAVETMGIRDNTIIIFMSDNGPNSTYFTAGLRAKKGSVYENGIRSPFVISWPSGFQMSGKEPRKFNDPAMHIDLLPTLADACGIKLPAGLQVDGKSILPLLTGKVTELPQRYLFMQHNRANVPPKANNCMIRKGVWKVVKNTSRRGDYELYNIETDPREKKDVAAHAAGIVQIFVQEYYKWFDDVTAGMKRTGGMPYPVELNPVQPYDFRFTWQDWWGDKTGWRPTNYGRWRMNNPALIDRFDITIVPHRQHYGKAATVKFIWQGKTVEKTFESLPASVELENLELAKGTGFMEAQLHAGGKMRAVREVQIRPHSATKTTPAPEKPAARATKAAARVPVGSSDKVIAGGKGQTQGINNPAVPQFVRKPIATPQKPAASTGNAWIIDSQSDWLAAASAQSNLEFKDGFASPTAKEATFRSVLKTFDKKRSAGSLTIGQSPVWHNWEPVQNIGPVNLGDAPVMLTTGPGDYWMFGRYRASQKRKGFGSQAARLKGFDMPLLTTPFPRQYDAPGGLKKGLGGYHAWQSKDMVNWVHHGPVTEAFSSWVTTAEYVDGKLYLYYDYPNDQDPHLYIDKDLTDGVPGKNMGLAFNDPSHGSDCAFIRDLQGKFHVIYEDWSPIDASTHSWDSPLAGHAISSDGIGKFKILPPAVDARTKPTGRSGEYPHPHWHAAAPKKYPGKPAPVDVPRHRIKAGDVRAFAKYEIHEPEQDAFGDWASVCIGGQYYLFGDYHPAKSSIRVGWFTSSSINKPFTFCGEIGKGHPDPDIMFAEGKFYLATQMSTDYVSPGPWVEKVETRAGVDTDNDGKIDKWSSWAEVKEKYGYIKGFSKQIARTPASTDLSALPEGYGFQIELRLTDSTANKSKPVIDQISLSFKK